LAAYQRVHIEVTNVCGLACSFCPPKEQPPKTMPLERFENALLQLKGLTKQLAFHLMGDPLMLANLEAYLALAHQHGFQVELTTSGHYLTRHPLSTLMHPAVRQINISLNSYDKNRSSFSLQTYLTNITTLCEAKLAHYPRPFINLRLWNLDEQQSDAAFNTEIFAYFAQTFGIRLSLEALRGMKRESIRLAPKIRVHFDHYFVWPSLDSAHHSEGYCLGLRSHIGILADGRVVPCCLDANGVITLGNIDSSTIREIVQTPRALALRQGFRAGKAVEELCQKCSYKTRLG
jgi:radical SAM protein with 4Fe4S-binding SPASM domain